MRLTAIFSACTLAIYAYLGIFSRHLADDYCSVTFTRSNFFTALWTNYQNVSDRFTNFMLIALSESIWPRSVTILPALMLVLWVTGIAWLLHEASHFHAKGWGKSITWTLTLLLVFFTLLQAPNRYQMLYWRSSMATHFAPLVFMPYFATFLVRSISSAAKNAFSRWMYPLGFFIAFLLGGFSEPTVTVMISLLGFAIIAAWMWLKFPSRGAALSLLAWSFAGAVLALLVMAIAPANSLRLGTPPPALPILISHSFRFAYEFALNSFKTLPLPTLFTIFMPFIIFYGLYALPVPALTQLQRKRVWIMLAVAPLLSYLLIVASFAPSVYGQSYPVERARFAGQLCLVAALMIEGAGLGTLLAQWRPRVVEAMPVQIIAAVLLGITALYPLRAAWLALMDVPQYRERASLWDMRDAYIFRRINEGQTDLVIPEFPGINGVKELDVRKDHWINKCAAEYYDVNSIRTVPVPDEELYAILQK